MKLKNTCRLEGIPNECLRHLPRIPLVYLFNHCLQLSHFPKLRKEEKFITILKDPKFPQNLHPIGLLSTTGKLFKKVILKIVQ
jgi:hypothetical protein